MGCGASSPAVQTPESVAEDVALYNNTIAETPPKHASTANGAGDEESTKGAKSGDGEEDAEAKGSDTRHKRLTVVNRNASLDLGAGLTELLKECEDEGAPIADLLIACATRAGKEPGYRKTNQDSYAVHEKFASTTGSFFAVFDGHGPNGHLVSGLAKERVPALLLATKAHRDALRSDPAHALTRAFANVDGELNDADGIDIEYSGSTAVACVLQGSTLTTAWCGDSRAVLAREVGGRMEVVALTEDHKPDGAGER
eukprot:CAMPEP_0181377034 /NCGR_PEP_ID=MMETSP1106-20121128/17660_1 /TAXON_ID=81844 /ORGANISM="Mantoniella antarctica, Strain SL-175" /LENGTH=255 /DNA_ID=CAMNT_0023495699 /DNA_START=168 /DNA_END=932 /DNA_ORIENTATION=+